MLDKVCDMQSNVQFLKWEFNSLEVTLVS